MHSSKLPSEICSLEHLITLHDGALHRDGLPKVVKAEVLKKYDGRCALCNDRDDYQSDADVYPIIPMTLKGDSQLRWLRQARMVESSFGVYSPQNLIALCNYHKLIFHSGIFTVCPPLEDLRNILKWEETDWKRRLDATELSDRQPIPRRHLSGNVSFLWLFCPNATLTIIGNASVAYSCPIGPGLEERWFPQDVTLAAENGAIPNLPTTLPNPLESGVETEFQITFNDINGPECDVWRLDPMVTMVRAMDDIGTCFVPSNLFLRRKDHMYPLANAMEEYHRILLRLRVLLSRTVEDCEVERRKKGIRAEVV